MNVVQLTLHKKLLELKAKNPRLSDRYFAQKLGVSSGALSEILKGKRRISQKLAERLADRLQMSPVERERFLRSFSETPQNLSDDSVQLADDQFQLISDWVHFAILNLVKSRACQHRPAWFAHRLNVSVEVTREALDRLLRLGLLVFEKNRYRRTNSNLHTSDDVLNLSLRKSHLQDLQLIAEQLENLDLTERDMTSMTLLLSPEKMPEFKKALRRFQDQFGGKYETTQSETAFRLTMALFPLKKTAPQKSKRGHA